LNRPRLSSLLSTTESRFGSSPPAATVMETASVMVDQDYRVVAVVKGGRLQGLVTRGDLLRYFVRTAGHREASGQISHVMTEALTVADPQMPLIQALELMDRNCIDYLPVVDQGRLMGIVPKCQLLRGLVEALQSDCRHIQDYIEHLHQAGQD
jgi:CBS domain-containing protein